MQEIDQITQINSNNSLTQKLAVWYPSPVRRTSVWFTDTVTLFILLCNCTRITSVFSSFKYKVDNNLPMYHDYKYKY